MNIYKSVSIVILSIIVLAACGEKPVEEKTAAYVLPVKLMTISSAESRSTRSFPAKIAANKQADLSFRIGGVLQERPPFEGTRVKKGDLLAELEDKDAKNTQINREADYELAQADFRRVQKLLKKKLISQADFDTAQAKLKSAKAALSTAHDHLTYTRLYAPFAGIIAKVSVDNFQVVGANQTILTLQKTDTVDLEVQIPEKLVAKYLSHDRYKSIKSSAQFVGDSANTYPVFLKEFSSQVTTGTQAYQVVYSMPQLEELALLPGMTAVVNFKLPDTDISKQYPVVPLTAVEKKDSNGKTLVWIYEQGKVRAQQVTLGKITTEGVEVIGGVKAGDQVVTAGVLKLTNGQMVKPLKWERGV